MRRLTLFLVLVLLTTALFAQEEESYAFVLFAEGFDMNIYRNDELFTYDVLRDDVIGMPLLPGDLVQTDPDTFVEIQIMPSRTVMKVAENTTFRIEQIGGDGGGSFDLAYGRLRARVERVTGNERFQVRGRTAVAGVRGTDFGYDFVASRQGSLDAETQVYVFEGSVEVTETVEEAQGSEESAQPAGDGGQGEGDAPAGEDSDAGEPAGDAGEPAGDAGDSVTLGSGGTGEPQTIIISANEMVRVIREVVDETLEARERGAAEPQPVSFESQLIEEQIEQFWQEKDFQEEPVAPDQVEQRFPQISREVERLALEREVFLLAQARATLEDDFEGRREPRQLRLAVPPEEERLRRAILPEDRSDRSISAERGGAVLTATGTLLGATALGLAVAGDQVISGYETGFDNSLTSAVLLSGGVFISSGLVSLILSFF
ncbi:MAG: FecR domain-containing protein [Spirochaetaceae bacterium]